MMPPRIPDTVVYIPAVPGMSLAMGVAVVQHNLIMDCCGSGSTSAGGAHGD